MKALERHTRGPWHLGPNGMDVRNVHEENIVTVKYVPYIGSRVQEANARLIAAAPELLEALCDMLSTEECVCSMAELEDGQCSVCLYSKLVDRINGVNPE